MKNWLTEYFYHTKAERRGALLLAILAVLLFLLPRAYSLFVEPANGSDYQAYADSVAQYLVTESSTGKTTEAESILFYFDPNTLPQDSLVLLGLSRKTAQTIVKFRNKVRPFRQPEDLLDIYTLDEADYQRLLPYIRIQQAPNSSTPSTERAYAKAAPNDKPYTLFPFDPNTLSGDSLQLLGIRGRTVRTLLKYREKGGRFRKKEDLQKVYGLRAETYDRIEEYIQIEEKGFSDKPTDEIAEAAPSAIPVSYDRPAEPASIDINRASPEEWQQLPGIGPAYARRICAFRDKLGGFVRVEQVAETYGLPDSTFQQLRPKLQPSPVFRKINVNTADAAALQAHPYLGWKQANAIVAYRNQHGAFSSLEEVAKVRALPSELHEKMRGYWSVD
jgi:competence ComEA-like helix-hairpin-helix protein